jgi:hypothetical protein
MLHDPCSISHAVAVLNEAAAADPMALAALIAARVECNDALAAHPSIQVGPGESGGPPVVGLLGILNGIFGNAADGWGAIAAVYDVDCPRGCRETPARGRIGDPCETCGATLVLGRLTGFRQIRSAEGSAPDA